MKVLALGILRIYGVMQPHGVLGGDHPLAMPDVLLSSLTQFRYVQVGSAGTKDLLLLIGTARTTKSRNNMK